MKHVKHDAFAVLSDEQLIEVNGGAKSAFSQLCENGDRAAKAGDYLVASFFHAAATAVEGGNRICVPGGY